jgi:hypothetical protein
MIPKRLLPVSAASFPQAIRIQVLSLEKLKGNCVYRRCSQTQTIFEVNVTFRGDVGYDGVR